MINPGIWIIGNLSKIAGLKRLTSSTEFSCMRK